MGKKMIKFLFVTGSHKSGTSWLARLINAHPKIALPDQELWLLGTKAGLSECIDRALGEWFRLPTVKNQFTSAESLAAASLKIQRAAIRGAIDAGVSGLKDINVIGDKTPAFYANSYQRLAEIFPDAHYVHIVRDPRDVIVSHHFHAYRLEEWGFFGDPEQARRIGERINNGEDVGFELIDNHALKNLVRDWKDTQESGLKAESAFSPNYKMLTYENLLENTTNLLSDIFSLVNEPLSEGEVSQIVAQFTFEKMSDGRKLGETDSKSFFRKGGSGGWVDHFSDEQTEYVRDALGDVMQRFGYH